MLYLASTSPRRAALLRAAAIEFAILAPGVEPDTPGVPIDLALERARAKALGADVQSLPPARSMVLGVDTVVDLGGVELGKPVDAVAAADSIRRLAGREHLVHTGHVLVAFDAARAGPVFERVETARVRFGSIDPERLARFVATGCWRGKAGGYGIQDVECGDFARLVDGDLDTVVGLSVDATRALLREAAC